MRPSKLRLPLSTADGDEVALGHRLGDRLGQRAAVADAGRAAVADGVESRACRATRSGRPCRGSRSPRASPGPGWSSRTACTVSPFSTAFFASRPAAIITEGLLVFVQLVMAAITTAPWPIVGRCGRCRRPWPCVSSAASSSAKPRSAIGALRAPCGTTLSSPAAARDPAAAWARRGSARPCSRSSDSVLRELRLGRVVGAEQALLLVVALDQIDFGLRCGRCVAGSRSVSSSTGKKPIVAPYSGAMLAIVARSASDMRRDAGAEELDELADHAVLAQDLRDGQHQVGRGRARRQLAGELEADHFGHAACRSAGRACTLRPRCRRRPSRRRPGR